MVIVMEACLVVVGLSSDEFKLGRCSGPGRHSGGLTQEGQFGPGAGAVVVVVVIVRMCDIVVYLVAVGGLCTVGRR